MRHPPANPGMLVNKSGGRRREHAMMQEHGFLSRQLLSREAHGRPANRLTNRLCIGVSLAATNKRFDVGCRDQPHVVRGRFDRASPVMRSLRMPQCSPGTREDQRKEVAILALSFRRMTTKQPIFLGSARDCEFSADRDVCSISCLFLAEAPNDRLAAVYVEIFCLGP